jgi:agmatine deiminase
MNRRRFLSATATIGLPFMARSTMAESPAFHVPPEEAPHEFTLMQWPNSPRVYDDADFLQDVQATILNIANAIAAFEPVLLLADAALHATIQPRLTAGVSLWDIPTEDLWARDSGPIIAVDGKGNRQVSHIRFNGWGNRQVHSHDGQIAARVAERLGLPLIPSPLQGEAGGVEQDGHGLLIAHESSWLHDNRNPGMARADIEAALLAAYGASRMIWSPGLRDEDITDYHIDSLLRLTGPNRVLINMPQTPDPGDPFHQAAAATLAMVQAEGLEVDVIFEPERRRVQAVDFVASYANYFVCNGAVIAAQFGDGNADAAAEAALARHYPGRQIVMLNADALGEIGGGIHCATHEVPSA